MVVVKKMMKWSSSSKPMMTTTESKKFQVKVKSIKLQGVDDDEEGMEKAVMVEMIWKGPKARLPPLHRISKSNDLSSKKMILMNNNGCYDVEWDEEFECVCSFTVKDGVFSPWEVSFRFLQGENGEPKNKFASLGTVSLNIAELASEMKGEVERKLPVVLQIVGGGGGVSREVSLLITLSFIEVRVDSPETIQEANEPEKVEGFLKKLRRYGSRKKKKKVEIEQGQEPNDDRVPSSVSGDTDESTTFDSEGSPDSYDLGSNQQSQELVNNILEPDNSLEIYYNNESNAVTQSESEQAVGFWRKRRLSFRSSSKRKDQQLIKIDGVAYSTQDSVHSTTKENERSLGTSESDIGSWEEKELISRDGHLKLKSNVFFASIDQRSEKASGESACTALVTIIADWLQSNKDTMPTRTQFDTLIMEGSSEWRKLCENEALIQHFPDKHFDLETVIEANLRPLSVVHNKSFVGFFCPERFESLKGAMSFDEIWNHLTSNVEEGESHTYIVSWNDHFFVMKVEAGMYYIIDTLGERLFEGCNQAYILKFDDQSEMYKLPDKSVKSSKEMDDGAEIQDKDQSCSSGEETEELVCKGKECCLEFLKRFLAAIPLRELEMEQKKGTISSIPLYQRLQIEVHYSSSSNSPSS